MLPEASISASSNRPTRWPRTVTCPPSPLSLLLSMDSKMATSPNAPASTKTSPPLVIISASTSTFIDSLKTPSSGCSPRTLMLTSGSMIGSTTGWDRIASSMAANSVSSADSASVSGSAELSSGSLIASGSTATSSRSL